MAGERVKGGVWAGWSQYGVCRASVAKPQLEPHLELRITAARQHVSACASLPCSTALTGGKISGGGGWCSPDPAARHGGVQPVSGARFSLSPTHNRQEAKPNGPHRSRDLTLNPIAKAFLRPEAGREAGWGKGHLGPWRETELLSILLCCLLTLL